MIDREEFLRLQAIYENDDVFIDECVTLLEKLIDDKILKQLKIGKIFCELSKTEILSVTIDRSIMLLAMSKIKLLYKDYIFTSVTSVIDDFFKITLRETCN